MGVQRKMIAIVEDETAIRDNYADALKRHGYQVEGFSSRREAWVVFQKRLPDLALLDIGLEEAESGFELCRDLRAKSPTLPIIFLTARDSDFDAVAGLRLGADDYLTKEVSLPHLLARIGALFRRVTAMASPLTTSCIKRGPLQLDPDRMQATWNGGAVELTVTEFWMTYALAHHPGHVKNTDQLMDAANITVDEATIRSHIKRIRRKFARLDSDFSDLETVYGMGYRWHAHG